MLRMNNTVNADPAELHKFSEPASRWWDRNSEFRPLHEINPLRLEWIDEHANLSDKRVLDVGCGGGILSESMAHKGADVLGIDLADPALTVARLHALETNVKIKYRKVAAEDCAVEMPHSFDVVTCLEMLEHVPCPGSIVAACAAMVRPGGRVFFSTINRNAKAWLLAIVGAEQVLKLLPKGTHEFDRFIRPAELAAFCRPAGLRIDEIIGLTYNPLNKTYRLEDDISVNYMMAATRIDSTSA